MQSNSSEFDFDCECKTDRRMVLRKCLGGSVSIAWDTGLERFVVNKVSTIGTIRSSVSNQWRRGGQGDLGIEVACLTMCRGQRHLAQMYAASRCLHFRTLTMHPAFCGDLVDYLSSLVGPGPEPGYAAPVPLVRLWTQQLASAVAFLHSHGVAHLDISLENILLDHYGAVQLCDFGMVFCLQKGHTRTLELISKRGKGPYMAPEIAQPQLQPCYYDPRLADVFSLGVCVLTLLTGHQLWSHPSELPCRLALRKGGIRTLLHKHMKHYLPLVLSLPQTALQLVDYMVSPVDIRLTINAVLRNPWLQLRLTGQRAALTKLVRVQQSPRGSWFML
jgi:serine/threonine protein kinase